MTTRTAFGRVASVVAAVAVLALSTSNAFAQTTTTVSNNCPAAVPAAGLRMGMTSASVTNLQKNLNHLGFTVATAGVGSKGMETSYFGPATSAAVKKFQEAYRAQVLTPAGLSTATGYYGAMTQAQMVKVCASSTSDDDSSDDDSTLSGGEATIDDFDVKSGNDVAEGESEIVATVELQAEDADLMVERLDLEFMNATTTSPWNVFDSVSLEVDGDEIASVDASDRDEWSKEGSYYRLRFTDIEQVVEENDTVQIDVVVEVAGTVRDLDQTWTVRVPANGVRTVDGEGLNDYNTSADSTTFDVVSETSGADLKVRKTSDNPSAQTLEVNTDSRSDEYTVLAFDIEAEDVAAIVNGATFRLDFSGSENYGDVVNDATLVLDGQDFNVDTVGSTTATTTTITFDVDGDVEIDADDSVDGELVLEFRSSASYVQGTTVKATLTVVDAETESGASLDETVTVAGETMTLVSEGLTAKKGTTSAKMIDVDGSTVDRGDYTVRFDVTAMNDDFYLPKTAVRNASLTAGVAYEIEGSGEASVTTGITTANLSAVSTVDTDGAYWVVQEGETETFELAVSYTPSVAGFYNVQLLTLGYNKALATPNATFTFSPENDFQTSSVNLAI